MPTESPNTVLVYEITDDVIDGYLRSLGITIWGKGMDVQSDGGRQAAITEIRKLLDGLDDFAHSMTGAD